MSWLCSCGLLNSGLNEQCAASQQTQLEHKQISENKSDFVMATVAMREVNLNSAEVRAIISSIKFLPTERLEAIKTQIVESETEEEINLGKKIGAEIERRQKAEQVILSKTNGPARKDMTSQEELFAKFYTHEAILVKDMDLITLREHRDELQKIAFEAKARLTKADDELKERKAKTANKEWLVTDTRPDVKVSDAINAVKIRAARMSKMDKVQEGLRKAGIDEETIKEMTRNLEKKATDKTLKTITFNAPTIEIKAVQVKSDAEPKEPFNPASLGFSCPKCKQNPCRCDGLTPVLA